MLHRCGMLYWNSFVNACADSPVMVFCHVRKGTSNSPASSNAM